MATLLMLVVSMLNAATGTLAHNTGVSYSLTFVLVLLKHLQHNMYVAPATHMAWICYVVGTNNLDIHDGLGL